MNKIIFLEDVRLQESLGWCLRRYKAAEAKKTIPTGHTQADDFKRWAVALEAAMRLSKKGSSVLDVGCGAGQFVNAAGKSGHFGRVTGIDRVQPEDLQVFTKQFSFVQKSIFMPQNKKLQSDVVVCLDTLAYIKSRDLPAALENLKELAKKTLIISVPYRTPVPLPEGQLQIFDEKRIKDLFKTKNISYLVSNGHIQHAFLEIDMDDDG